MWIGLMASLITYGEREVIKKMLKTHSPGLNLPSGPSVWSFHVLPHKGFSSNSPKTCRIVKFSV